MKECKLNYNSLIFFYKYVYIMDYKCKEGIISFILYIYHLTNIIYPFLFARNGECFSGCRDFSSSSSFSLVYSIRLQCYVSF